MAEVVIGAQALERRLAAISGGTLGVNVMRSLGQATVREARLLAPRKTSTLSRSIHVASTTATTATVIASARYAAYVEFGTRGGQIITPMAAKALAWAPGPAGGKFSRLSGAIRKGVRSSSIIFAKRVVRGATPKQPFLIPGAKAAVAKSGLRDAVVKLWNEAA